MHRRSRRIAIAGLPVALILMGVLAHASLPALLKMTGRTPRAASKELVYTPAGYGGLVMPNPPAPFPAAALVPRSAREGGEAVVARGEAGTEGEGRRLRWSSALAAYGAGRFAQAEQLAEEVASETPAIADTTGRHRHLQALAVVAYAQARQKEYSAAAEGFTALRQAAAKEPDHGQEERHIGENLPTWEQEAAFQHAVCIGAEGNKERAEGEYRQFLNEYPNSILIHAAVKRIARYHGGDVPHDTESLWKQAMKVQREHELQKRAAEAVCGPECVVELLRRGFGEPQRSGGRRGSAEGGETTERANGRPGEQANYAAPNAEQLARLMHTDASGSSMAALVEVAGRYGLRLEGVQLSEKGLKEQKLPLVGLIAPQHYVLVEQLSPDAVTVWDPDLNGIGKGGERAISWPTWRSVFSGGFALVVR